MVYEAAHWIKTWTKQMLAPAARLTTRRCARVVMYHRFGLGGLDVRYLEEQLCYMRRYFNVVPLGDIVSRLRSGMAPDPCTVAVTVDDGYADFGELAYPVFRRNGIPVTLYVVSEFASGKIWLWWDAIRYILTRAHNGCYGVMTANGLITVSLSDAISREAEWHTLADIGLTLSPGERDQYIRDLQESFSVSLPNSPTEDFAALDWDALRALDPEIVEIGSHSCTHPILSRCSAEGVIQEVAESKRTIEEQLGREVRAFCYPNGQWLDVNDQCFGFVKK
jgi:peptidoglycan/xylan/chitin deacetylase (PgdA/CDA1 family)